MFGRASLVFLFVKLFYLRCLVSVFCFNHRDSTNHNQFRCGVFSAARFSMNVLEQLCFKSADVVSLELDESYNDIWLPLSL